LYSYFDAREFNSRQADIASSKALELAPAWQRRTWRAAFGIAEQASDAAERN
jgi:hypothetical protein